MNEKALGVLDQYELAKENTFKIRGNYGMDTPSGKFIMKEYSDSEEKMIRLRMLQNHLDSVGVSTEMIMINQTGKYVSISEDGYAYILHKMYDMDQCDIKDEIHIKKATRVLAQFHKASMDFQIAEPGVKENEEAQNIKPYHKGKNLVQAYEKHNKELGNIRNYINKRGNKNRFEMSLQEIIPQFFEQAKTATEKLKQTKYNEIYMESLEKHYLCHGNFTHHSIGFCEDKVILLDLMKVNEAPFIHDLYDFLRKVLEKNQWKKEVGDLVINTYNEVFKLDNYHIYILKALLTYPVKFWKVVNYYYNSNKAWYSEKNEEKLNNFLEQEKARWEYIESIDI